MIKHKSKIYKSNLSKFTCVKHILKKVKLIVCAVLHTTSTWESQTNLSKREHEFLENLRRMNQHVREKSL